MNDAKVAEQFHCCTVLVYSSASSFLFHLHMMRRNNLGKMKSEHIKKTLLSRVNRQIFLCFIFHKPPHHIIILLLFSMYIYKLNAILLYFLLLAFGFLFSLISSTENDYGEQNDNDVRCGSRWAYEDGNNVKEINWSYLWDSFSFLARKMEKICLWMYPFLCENLWCAVCDLNKCAELSNYLTRKAQLSF